MRKAIVGVFGRFAPPGTGGNYRLDGSKSRIEAATTFATSGSIINEVVHTVAAMPTGIIATTSIAEGRYGADVLFNVAITGLNLGLVALQRYNRARMIKRVDEELAAGATFRPDYVNWFGIDAGAVENYREALNQQGGDPTPIHQPHDTNAMLPRPEMH